MSFVTRDDCGASIRLNVLDSITEFDDSKFEMAVSWATSEMAGHMCSKYDTEAIFSATGNNRSPIVRMFCIDMALYHLHSVLSPKKIPEHRKDRYADAKQWLSDLSAGIINPPDLPRIIDGTKDYVIFGGRPPRSNYI